MRPARRFAFRLALAMGRTVKELLEAIDSAELTEWMAYDRIEPFGAWRDDLRSGIVASVVANANRAKNSKPFTPDDFMPKFREKPSQSDLGRKLDRLFKTVQTWQSKAQSTSQRARTPQGRSTPSRRSGKK